eukprot:gene6032-6106_t
MTSCEKDGSLLRAKAVTLVEYGLLACMVAIAMILALNGLENTLVDTMNYYYAKYSSGLNLRLGNPELAMVNVELAMSGIDDGYSLIYRVMDRLDQAPEATPGMRATIVRAVARLRADNAPVRHIAIAERLSATLHTIEWAMLMRDEARLADGMRHLASLRTLWLSLPAPRH